MKNLTPEMIEKAKAAKSAEELLEIAKANGVELTADEAATYFAQLNPKSGELDDDDLDNVAGGKGGCESNSTGRTVVTSGCKCFTGQYQLNSSVSQKELDGMCPIDRHAYCIRNDNKGRRDTWFSFGGDGTCGYCVHLEFEGGTGVCGKTGK